MTVADKSRPRVCSTALWHLRCRRAKRRSGRGSMRCVYSKLVACAFSACVSQEAGVRMAVMLQSERDWPAIAAGVRSTNVSEQQRSL